jgi:hypothetical protein
MGPKKQETTGGSTFIHLTAEGLERGKGEYHVNGWVRDKYLKIGGGTCPAKPGEFQGDIPGMGPPSATSMHRQ